MKAALFDQGDKLPDLHLAEVLAPGRHHRTLGLVGLDSLAGFDAPVKVGGVAAKVTGFGKVRSRRVVTIGTRRAPLVDLAMAIGAVALKALFGCNQGSRIAEKFSRYGARRIIHPAIAAGGEKQKSKTDWNAVAKLDTKPQRR